MNISRCNSPSSVLVQIGSMYGFSLRLKRTKVEIEGSASCSGSHPQGEPRVGISAAFSSEYDIDWCKFRLVSEILCESFRTRWVYFLHWTPKSMPGVI